MKQHMIDPERYLSQVEAIRREEGLFHEYYQPVNWDKDGVAGMRRRRRRVTNGPDSPIKTVSLVEEDGVLYWRDGIPVRIATDQQRGRRRARHKPRPPTEGNLVMIKEFPTLAPNKIIAAIGSLDRRLNPAIAAPLCSRLRVLQTKNDGSFELGEGDVTGPFDGRTLLFVHGTFSSASNMLAEFTRQGEPAVNFLNRATRGPKKYHRVLFFDHPTLAVSPIINALELGRALAGSKGQIDVIAHSRGGLVVRWWLEAFGNTLQIAPAKPVRAVLVGSPLHGTSLAAPDKIQHALSLFSNIGTFAEKTLNLVGVGNPFLWIAGKLVEVIVSVTGVLAKTPLVDGLVAIIPGLSGQSAVSNNYEINRLREGPVAVNPAYYAIMSNFETEDPGWKFWRNFRKDRAADLLSDIVFPGDNDLVVDTMSMKDFGVPALKVAGPPCDFNPSDKVWHCSYFRAGKTIDYISNTFKV